MEVIIIVYKEDILDIKEIANRALSLLDDVERQLKSVKSWGVFDLVGGGFFASVVKDDEIDKAESLLEATHKELVLLQKRLGAIDLPADLKTKISNLDDYLNIVFDNISDWMNQSRVIDSLRELTRLRLKLIG